MVLLIFGVGRCIITFLMRRRCQLLPFLAHAIDVDALHPDSVLTPVPGMLILGSSQVNLALSPSLFKPSLKALSASPTNSCDRILSPIQTGVPHLSPVVVELNDQPHDKKNTELL